MVLMCQMAHSPSIVHPCNFAFSYIFFQDNLTLKKMSLVKLGHFDVPNSLIFKNHRFHHCFQKLIKSRIFPRLMNSYSKLGAFAHRSLTFKKKKKKKRDHRHHFFQKKKKSSSRFPKNHAFILNQQHSAPPHSSKCRFQQSQPG